MTRSIPSSAQAPLVGLLFGLACTLAVAQQEPSQPEAAATEPPTAAAPAEFAPRLQVGDATHDLLALQRDGRLASRTPRPISGDAAHLSYERYLKSFTHEIPVDFKSSVGQQKGNAKK